MLLVDDHADVRMLLRVLLEQAGLRVLGEASSGAEALAAGIDADVVVVDGQMPGMDGFELARRLRSVRPQQAIVLCSGVVDDDVRRRATEAGMAACVAKEDVAEVARVVAQVARKNNSSGCSSGLTSSSR